MHVRTGEYVVAEKVVAEDEETGLLHATSGLRSNGSLHSVGTHDSSSSLDWTIDAVPSKARCLSYPESAPAPCSSVTCGSRHGRAVSGVAQVGLRHAFITFLVSCRGCMSGAEVDTLRSGPMCYPVWRSYSISLYHAVHCKECCASAMYAGICYVGRPLLQLQNAVWKAGCCDVQASVGDVIIDLGKAGVEAKEHGRQRQQLDWREASPPQPLDARTGQPVLLQACSSGHASCPMLIHSAWLSREASEL